MVKLDLPDAALSYQPGEPRDLWKKLISRSSASWTKKKKKLFQQNMELLSNKTTSNESNLWNSPF